jgi:transketolase
MKIDKKIIQEMSNCIRFLSMDAVQKANSGHPGMPMGMADVATILFSNFLKFNPRDPKWLGRDRFILSAGHGSMLLYSLFYLTGYQDINIDDLKKFRQLHSKTAGHPEYGELAGIETTTGPLGQGLANAVGMALGQKMQAAKFGDKIFGHKIYCVAGDGCLMEGISQEAISLAGHLALNSLILLWDDNSISIDGGTDLTTSENTKMRFEACNWAVYEINGHDFDQIKQALKAAQNSTKPVLIACKTIIAYGSPNKAGSEKSHGSPLGEDEIKQVRKNLNWQYEPFEIPDYLRNSWLEAGNRSNEVYKIWQNDFQNLNQETKSEINRLINKELPKDFIEKLQQFKQSIFTSKSKQATRKSSSNYLEFLTKELPELIGGSADLTESVLTKTSSTKAITKNDFSGRYIHYGIREHAMAAMMNGLSLYGGFIPYGGTFLVFSDYMKPAIRLAALMKLPVIYIFTHDSIGLGEDGPTHQPIEHLAALRAIPNINIFRPADSYETAICFELALKNKQTPSAMILTRQNVDFITSDYNHAQQSCKAGGYIICESETEAKIKPSVVIIASGSEIGIAIKTKEKLQADNIIARIVSMTSIEIFAKQSKEYQDEILGLKFDDKNILRIVIEAGVAQPWYRYLRENDLFIGMDSFGASAKAEDLYQHFKITADNAYNLIIEKLKS